MVAGGSISVICERVVSKARVMSFSEQKTNKPLGLWSYDSERDLSMSEHTQTREALLIFSLLVFPKLSRVLGYPLLIR